ncbi:hemolysin family protein [uncultured Neglectibacter sp.]|uniref:hemolysin family protein n=1 Tax=uncultured Neglectibacter sp. TaxID=1924108 RepID=UPI0034E0459E
MPAEPDGSSVLCILFSVLLLILAAFYSAADSALDSLSPSQLKKEAEAGEKRAKKLQKALDAQTGIVFPIQYGLLFAGLLGIALWSAGLSPILCGAFSALKPAPLRGVLACLLSALCYLLLFTVFGDLLPKKGVRKNPQRFVMRHAGLIWALSQLAKPFLLLCARISNGILRLFRIDPKSLEDAVTEEEILQIVGEGEEKGVIEETEKDMIANILDFNDTTVGETMTHRTDILAVADDASIGEAVEVAVENGCSRIPVYHEDIDSVVGICYVKDLLPYVGKELPDFVSLTDMMRPAYFIPETKKCSQLFTEMTERKVQIAIVVDEYGGTAGLITLEDLVESIVGNIQDEYDNEEEEIQQVSETEFTVDGTASIDEISDLTGIELPEGDYDTIAGFVTEQLGRIPKEDEHPSIEVSGLTITVLSVEDQRLARLLLVKNLPGEEAEENEE